MSGEFFFMAFGGVGVSLAGFAGLLAAFALRNSPPMPVAQSRISEIVRSSFQLAFLGFGVVAVFALTEDVEGTVRISSLAALVMLAYTQAVADGPGPSWPDERYRRQMTGVMVLLIVFVSVNIGLGSVGYLHLIMLVMLYRPASVFVRLVTDLRTGDAATEA